MIKARLFESKLDKDKGSSRWPRFAGLAGLGLYEWRQLEAKGENIVGKTYRLAASWPKFSGLRIRDRRVETQIDLSKRRHF